MYVIGTAGHVDHGKTLLIEALTGINADRLPEEKRRGLTIDLGFAHFYTPAGLPVGVIDVPGHERFIRNMVAGAWSLDLALLTVAADDGWMHQSSDHTRVLRLMGVPRLIAVITKTDLASSQRLSRLGEQVLFECERHGYAQVPTLGVSARTGQNIEALKGMILQELERPPGKAAHEPAGEARGASARGASARGASARGAPARGASAGSHGSVAHLFVDRVFTVKGAGVVITGSLRGGALEQGQELLLLPQGEQVRIRGLQSYYRECKRVEPVSRVAINLSGIEAQRIGRGDLLAEQHGPFQAVRECILRLSPALPTEDQKPAKRDTEVELAAGTGHQIARLTRFASGNLARIRLSRTAALCWNQPVVLIQHGGSAILGGGRVFWLGSSGKQQRNALAGIEPSLPTEMGPAQYAGLKLSVEGALSPEEARDLEPSAELGSDAVQMGGWIVSRERHDRLRKRIGELAAAPGGVRIDELATKVRGEAETLLKLAADRLVEAGQLSSRAGVLFPSGGQAPQVSPMGRQLLRDLRAGGSQGLELSKLKVAGARKELRNLVRAGLAVSLDGDIHYERQIYAGLVRSCLAEKAVGGILSIAETKNRTGLSRKFVIPLLNRMEADGFVKRSGDERVITALPP